MEEFVSLLMIVFGVLQIILFFKIWGATNDIDKLKSTICDKTHSVDRDRYLRKMHLLNKINEAEDFLNERCSEEIITIYDECTRNANVENEVWYNGSLLPINKVFEYKKNDVLNNYEPYYQLFDLKIPTKFIEININTLQKFGGNYIDYSVSIDSEE